MNKKIILLAIFLVSLLAVSAVSAEENMTGECVGIVDSTVDLDSNSELSAINHCDDLKATESNNVLDANSNTFTDSDDIKDNATIYLNECYDYSCSDAVINCDVEDGQNNCTGTVNSSDSEDIILGVVNNASKQDLNVNVSDVDIVIGEYCIVDVNNLADATGNVSVIVNNEVYIAPIIGSTANVLIPGLIESTTAVITYPGDDKYNNFTRVININVNPNPGENATISIIVSDNVEGEVVNVFVRLPNHAAGNVTLICNGETRIIDIADAIIYPLDGHLFMMVPYDNLTAGNYNVTAFYSGDDYYKPSNASSSFVISKVKKDLNVSVSDVDIVIGEFCIIDVNNLSDATGNITLSVNDETYVEPIVGGAVNFLVSFIIENTTAVITYPGDDKYNNFTRVINITVNPNPGENATISLIVSDNVVGEVVNVFVRLPNHAAGNVTLICNGETRIIDIADAIIYPFDSHLFMMVPYEGLTVGRYNITAFYSGDDYYKPSNASSSFVISKGSTNLTVQNVTATYDVDKYLTITLTDSHNSPISNATVTVVLQSVKEYITDVNGQIKILISNLTPNAYAAQITFKGNDKYDGSNATANVVVKKAASKINANVKTFIITDKTKKYSIILKDNKGNYINGMKVILKVNSKTYYANTNSKGKATFKLDKLTKTGKFSAVINFAGSTCYEKSTTNVKITVKKATPKLTAKAKTFKKSVKTKKYTITLKTNQNKVMKNTKVTLKVNGKTCSAKTNSKGQATFKITKLTKKGKFTATIKYAGSKYYNAKTVKAKITVK